MVQVSLHLHFNYRKDLQPKHSDQTYSFIDSDAIVHDKESQVFTVLECVYLLQLFSSSPLSQSSTPSQTQF